MIFYNLTRLSVKDRSVPDVHRRLKPGVRRRNGGGDPVGMSGISGRSFIRVDAGLPQRGRSRSRPAIACAHVTAVLSEIADEEDKASVAARAARPTPPDGPEFAEVERAPTIGEQGPVGISLFRSHRY